MDFKLSEQQQMLRQTVHDFAEKEIAPIAAEIDKSGEFPWDIVRKMAGLGLFGLLIPPAFDGSGPDKLGFLIAVEEVSRACAGLGITLICSNCPVSMILGVGNEELKAKYVPAMAKGERLGALAAAEPSGGANWPLTIQTAARLDGDSYVLNGSKCFISNAGEAEVYLVMARTAPEKGPMGISGLLVEKGTPGFSFGKKEDKLGLRADVSRELIFEDCRVPAANLLADSILMPFSREMSLTGMPAFGAVGLGLAEAALEAAMQYVKERAVAFGQNLANFDSVQCMVADMATMVEASRLLIYQAGSLPKDQQDLTPALMAGIFAPEAALEVTSKALQLFGTYGYTTDFPLERYFRDARGLLLVAQPMEVRKLIMGRLKLGLPPMAPPGGAPPGPGGPPGAGGPPGGR